MASFWVLLVTVLVFNFEGSSAQCQIDIGKDLQKKEPVFITREGELWIPTGSSLSWEKSEKTIIACGEKGDIAIATRAEAEIECATNKDFKVSGKTANISDIQCTTTVTGDIEITNEKCAKDGIIQKIGFKTKKFGLVKYFEVCYNSEIASVIYTNHTIYGKAIDNAATGGLRPTFKSAGVPRYARPSTSYKQTSQIRRMTALLGSEDEARKYISQDSFLSRGHLTPDADGLFRSWQHATYFYVNVAPQWQTINSRNWLRVENLARKMASKIQDNLEVLTGVFETLTLPDINGNDVELSLENDGIIPVPKWMWKIIKYKNAGIAFITLNNPFALKKESLCTDVCKKHGFHNEAFANLQHGYTYCCEVAHLMKIIPNIPKSARVKSVLKF